MIEEEILGNVSRELYFREIGIVNNQKNVARQLASGDLLADDDLSDSSTKVEKLSGFQGDIQVLHHMRELVNAINGYGSAIIELPSGSLLDLRTVLRQDTRMQAGISSDRPADVSGGHEVRP